MLHLLNDIDLALFLLFNVALANPVTDVIMPILTDSDILRGSYGVAMVLCLWRGDARLRWLVVFSAITLTITDQTSANLIKHLIERPRPCHVLENINLLVGCGGGFSMPSAHAANAFGQAVLFSLHYRAVRPWLYIWAALIALSRVMVGVHYPGDSAVGAIIGLLAGALMAELFFPFSRLVLKKRPALAPAATAPDQPDGSEVADVLPDRDSQG